MSEIDLHLYTRSLAVFHLTELNTYLLARNGEMLTSHVHDEVPDFLIEEQQQDILRLGGQQSESVMIYTNSWSLSYLCAPFSRDQDERGSLIVGPFLLNIPDFSKANSRLPHEQMKLIRLQEFYRGLKIISGSKLQSIVNLMDRADDFRQAPVHWIKGVEDDQVHAEEKRINSILRQSDESYLALIESKYALEKRFMYAVETGNMKLLRQMTDDIHTLFDFSERFPNQPVRAMKNMMVVLNTLLRIAAEKGKVPPLFLHQISEKFSKQIERSSSMKALTALIDQMYDEYIELVKEHEVTGYSPLVLKAVQYLKACFSEPVQLKQLAAYCGVHPSHLAREFKKQTGVTTTDYLHQLRINEAKRQLRKDHRSSVDWIAGYVGYEDAGYFTRIFKKIEGMTPSQFRATDSSQPHNQTKDPLV